MRRVDSGRKRALNNRCTSSRESTHGRALTGEHCGETPGLVGAVDGPDGAELHAQHLFVEEEEGIEGLILGGGGHFAVGSQVVEEGLHVLGVELVGMGGAVKADEAGDPADVGLLGVVAVLTASAGLPDVVEELGRPIGARRAHGLNPD